MSEGESIDLEDQDPGLLSALVAVIKEHAVGGRLEGEDQVAIASLAIEKGMFDNASWLEQKAKEFYEARQNGVPLGVVADGEGNLNSEPVNTFHEVVIPEKKEITCKEDLLAVLAQHKMWQESVLDPNKEIIGGRADLSGQVLCGYDLSGVDLRGVNLQNARIEDTVFDHASLATANLCGAKIYECSFKKANLKRSNLKSASFVSCDIEGADFSHAQLSHASWEDTDKSLGRFTAEVKGASPS